MARKRTGTGGLSVEIVCGGLTDVTDSSRLGEMIIRLLTTPYSIAARIFLYIRMKNIL